MKGELYMPSNGSEGDWFIEKHCMKCKNCNPDPLGEKQCIILLNSLSFDITHEMYPREWIYDKDNEPTCTSWDKWDWDKQGDPDNIHNENYQPPPDPNQIKMDL